jgi:HlyD family secretion protein
VVIIGLIFLSRLNKNGAGTYTVEAKDFEKVIESTGEVVPVKEVELAFEVSGKINHVYVEEGSKVKAGQILATLDASEIGTQINESVASKKIEEAKLDEISGSSQSNQINFAKSTLINTINKAYVVADDSIRNTVDTFITNPDLRRPEFTPALNGYFARKEIEDLRYEIGKNLIDWKEELSATDQEDVDFNDADQAISNLKKIENFLALISGYSYDFKPIDSITQSQIDAYISGISQARSGVSSTILDLNTKMENYRDILSEADIQQARINNASAIIQKLNVSSSKYVLRAPMSGVIAVENVKLGEFISAGQSIYKMTSDLPLQIEAHIPEVNIVGVDVDDEVIVTFDAVKGKEYKARIFYIDTISTQKDGIATYKIKLAFSDDITDIRSGMTANLEIKKSIVSNSIVIPNYLIKKTDGKFFVNLLEKDEASEKEIEVIDFDDKGNYLVESGLSVGDKLIEN